MALMALGEIFLLKHLKAEEKESALGGCLHYNL